MVCFLCRETFNEYYKICDCVDSTLCYECYKLTNQNNITKCSICRKPLKYNTKLLDLNFIKLIVFNILNYICLFALELIIPCYILLYIENNLMYFLYILYGLILFNGLNYYFILHLYQEEEIGKMIYLYNGIKVVYLIIYCIIFYFLVDKDKIIELYLIFILFVLYVVPVTFYVFFVNVSYKYTYFKELYRTNSIKLIKYRIFKEDNIDNNSINNEDTYINSITLI